MNITDIYSGSASNHITVYNMYSICYKYNGIKKKKLKDCQNTEIDFCFEPVADRNYLTLDVFT